MILEQPAGEKFVMAALADTDARVLADRPISPGFLFAALLWHEVLPQAGKLEAQGTPPMPALSQAMDEVLEMQKDKLAIPRRYDAVMKEIWLLQPRFLQRGGQRPFRLLAHARFRAAYDFFLLRAESGEVDPALGQWWREFAAADDDTRSAMRVDEPGQKKRRRRRGRRRPADGMGEASAVDGTAGEP